MRVEYGWLKHDFVRLSCEAEPGPDPVHELRSTLDAMEDELAEIGLTFANAVRTRLWARSQEARTAASAERRRRLDGSFRCASSSYIAPARFGSDASVRLDLVAMRPRDPEAGKQVVEFDPLQLPPRAVVYDDVAVLSGLTTIRPTLTETVAQTIRELGDTLDDVTASWKNVVEIACYARADVDRDELDSLLRSVVEISGAEPRYFEVQAHALDAALVEVEVTASLA